MLNKIKKLKKGDTIGIINPAFCNPANNDYKAMFAAFEEYGFKVSGKTMEFPGYTNVYKEFVEDDNDVKTTNAQNIMTRLYIITAPAGGTAIFEV